MERGGALNASESSSPPAGAQKIVEWPQSGPLADSHHQMKMRQPPYRAGMDPALLRALMLTATPTLSRS